MLVVAQEAALLGNGRFSRWQHFFSALRPAGLLRTGDDTGAAVRLHARRNNGHCRLPTPSGVYIHSFIQRPLRARNDALRCCALKCSSRA